MPTGDFSGRGPTRRKVETMTKILTAVMAVLALTLVFASMAPAQPSLGGYNDVGGNVQDQVDDEPTDDVAGTQESGGEDEPEDDVEESSGESLPFTGLDVALLVGAGGLLVALGFGMRRLTRTSAS
jgi:hypothetical protein